MDNTNPSTWRNGGGSGSHNNFTTPRRTSSNHNSHPSSAGVNNNNNATRLSPLSQPFTPTPPPQPGPGGVPNSASKTYPTLPATAYYASVMAIATPTLFPSLPAVMQAPVSGTPPMLGGRRVNTGMETGRMVEYHSVALVPGSENTFRAVNRSKGTPCVFRRVQLAALDAKALSRVLRKWQWTRHPNIVPMVNAFFSSGLSATGQDECIVEYKYIPDLMSIEGAKEIFSEDTVWSTAVQIACALRYLHSNGTALRTLSPSKACIGVWGRVYLLAAGCSDFVPQAKDISLEQQQTKDLEDLGTILLHMCCTGQHACNLETLLNLTHYTQALKFFVLALLPSTGAGGALRPSGIRPLTRIVAVWDILGERAIDELIQVTSSLHSIAQKTMMEIHSGRAMRVLIKLGFILDRPEHEKDPRWGEAGDRFLLKLFRNYVFHQCDEFGDPCLDWGHVASCIHKLDVGSEEKILLLSKDEATVLVTSFHEVRGMMEAAFLELQESRSRLRS